MRFKTAMMAYNKSLLQRKTRSRLLSAGERYSAPEPGMATVAVAAAMLLVAVITVTLMQFSSALAQRARLQNGADLAALAAASTYTNGYSKTQACERAAHIIRMLPDTPKTTCTCENNSMRISLETPSAFGWFREEIKVTAVAGPAP